MEIDNAMIMMVADRVKGKSRTFVNDTIMYCVTGVWQKLFLFIILISVIVDF